MVKTVVFCKHLGDDISWLVLPDLNRQIDTKNDNHYRHSDI